jgi:hypothetical protein
MFIDEGCPIFGSCCAADQGQLRMRMRSMSGHFFRGSSHLDYSAI